MLSRRLRLRVLQALETRAKQFRSREDVWPFRVPHEPLAFERVLDEVEADGAAWIDPLALKGRTVLRMDWTRGPAFWELWVVPLPSGIRLYCDTDGDEVRVLASVRRSTADEADRWFLELLGESRGHSFGIEISAAVPDRIRTGVDDIRLIEDVFVELFEGTDAERIIHGLVRGRSGGAAPGSGRDFRDEVSQWLAPRLTAPAAPVARRRRRRLRDEDDG